MNEKELQLIDNFNKENYDIINKLIDLSSINDKSIFYNDLLKLLDNVRQYLGKSDSMEYTLYFIHIGEQIMNMLDILSRVK